MTGPNITTVAEIIRLSVAPVFLLAGIAGMLNVVAARLARVVDRVRRLEKEIPTVDSDTRSAELDQLALLDRRIAICHLSIGMCTTAALLICLVIMILFVGSLVSINFAIPVALLFIAAMISLTAGLLLFLGEVTIATRSVRVNEQFLARGRQRREG